MLGKFPDDHFMLLFHYDNLFSCIDYFINNYFIVKREIYIFHASLDSRLYNI